MSILISKTEERNVSAIIYQTKQLNLQSSLDCNDVDNLNRCE